MYTPKGKTKVHKQGQLPGEFLVAGTDQVYTGNVLENKSTGKFTTLDGSYELIPTHDTNQEAPAPLPYTQYDTLRKDGYNLRSTSVPQPFTPTPTEEQYLLGEMARYVCYDTRSDEVFEIDATTYRDLVSKSNKYYHPQYITTAFPWKISGPVANMKVSGYIVEGASEINARTLKSLEDRIPNATRYFTDPSEFVK